MAANNYGLSYSNTLPGTIRSTYGTVNLGPKNYNSGYGAIHGEIFNGQQDEKMGIANYVPIVNNTPIEYLVGKSVVMMTGELVPLFAIPKKTSRGLRVDPVARAMFIRGITSGTDAAKFQNSLTILNNKNSLNNVAPVAILPLSSDFPAEKPGVIQTAHAAFSVQSVSDVMIPDGQPPIQALAGDSIYVQYDHNGVINDKNIPRIILHNGTTKDVTNVEHMFFLGKAMLNFDSAVDKNVKICL